MAYQTRVIAISILTSLCQYDLYMNACKKETQHLYWEYVVSHCYTCKQSGRQMQDITTPPLLVISPAKRQGQPLQGHI